MVHKEVHDFTCECGKADKVSVKEILEHLKTEHNMQYDSVSGKKRMVMHMSFDKYYSGTYEWTLSNGVKMFEYYETPKKNRW